MFGLGAVTSGDPPPSASWSPTHVVVPLPFAPADGRLRHVETGEPFVFNAREDLHRWNQKRYEALGEVQ